MNLIIAFHIVGDKANHVPVLHVPQLYYFVAFATLMGWPAVVFGRGGPVKLANEVTYRMFGTKRSVSPDKGEKPLISWSQEGCVHGVAFSIHGIYGARVHVGHLLSSIAVPECLHRIMKGPPSIFAC